MVLSSDHAAGFFDMRVLPFGRCGRAWERSFMEWEVEGGNGKKELASGAREVGVEGWAERQPAWLRSRELRESGEWEK